MGRRQVRARQQPTGDGYAAPQLHTHAVVFNITETADGNTRALQPQELYKTQQYATAVYRSELAAQLQGMGYEIERGEHGQPEIKGYTREYLEASSPRRQQIEEQLAEQGTQRRRSGADRGASGRAARSRSYHTKRCGRSIRQWQPSMENQPQRVVIAEAAQRPG